MVKALLPGAKDAVQRELTNWAIMDPQGAFLAPWHAGEAVFPGGVCGSLALSPHVDVDVEPISLRLEAPSEWHAQAADVLGQKLPVFWVKGAAAWYKLGEPHEEYRPFLRREVRWLLIAYRIGSFLLANPRSAFDEVRRSSPNPNPSLGLSADTPRRCARLWRGARGSRGRSRSGSRR